MLWKFASAFPDKMNDNQSIFIHLQAFLYQQAARWPACENLSGYLKGLGSLGLDRVGNRIQVIPCKMRDASFFAAGLVPMLSRRSKTVVGTLSIAVLIAAALTVHHFSGGIDPSARGQFLRFVPADTTAVIFFDFDQLRGTPFLAELEAWVPQVTEDSEYAQLVRETGFDYQRDLGKAFVAFAHHGGRTSTLILAEGKFDRNKIETYLSRSGQALQQGSLKVFHLPAAANGKALNVVALGRERIAISDSENVFATMADAVNDPGHAEWQIRFDRLAGSPVFAVIRQDPGLQQALGSAAPGGFRSPQLAGLLDQMQWISIAAKPDGYLLRLVAEGECPSDSVATQVSGFLQGLSLLAENGLNDPKLRQSMNPEEREAYLELLKSAEVQRLDRGESKSVRLALAITPRFLTLVKAQTANAESNPSAGQLRSEKKPLAKTAKQSKPK